jgi:DNA-binding NarL/FixJ family response regulator
MPWYPPNPLNDNDFEVSSEITEEGARLQIFLAITFLVILTVSVIDLILDRPSTIFSVHILLELLLVVVSLGATAYLGVGWFRSQRLARSVREEAERRARERDEWKERAAQTLEGLGRDIDRQFEAWGLTGAERETALKLLQGLSHKRIARQTDRSEKTVRQHAVAVYRKAGLAGRAELAGFFLGDLLLPGGQGDDE